MARTIGATEFQPYRGKILKAVRGGEQIAISRRGKVVAFLSLYKTKRRFGALKPPA